MSTPPVPQPMSMPAPQALPAPVPLPAPPQSTVAATVPAPEVQVVPEGVSKASERVQKKNRLGLKTAYVTVCIGQIGKDGKIHETLHQIDSDEFSISEVFVQEKAAKAKVKDDDGALVGFEPTGEQELVLKVKYHIP